MAEACGEHARDGRRHEHQHQKQRRSHRRSASASASTSTVRGLGSASPSPAAAAAAMEEERRLRRSPPVEARRERERRRAREQPRCGEVAGGTAAECAAVCCCFPCAVVELVVLAAVRVPAALCRRALRARARRRRASRAAAAKKKEMAGLLASDAASSLTAAAAKDSNGDALDFCYWPAGAAAARRDELAEAEAAVWASFQGAGFWRSPSQCEERRGGARRSARTGSPAPRRSQAKEPLQRLDSIFEYTNQRPMFGIVGYDNALEAYTRRSWRSSSSPASTYHTYAPRIPPIAAPACR